MRIHPKIGCIDALGNARVSSNSIEINRKIRAILNMCASKDNYQLHSQKYYLQEQLV